MGDWEYIRTGFGDDAENLHCGDCKVAWTGPPRCPECGKANEYNERTLDHEAYVNGVFLPVVQEVFEDTFSVIDSPKCLEHPDGDDS
jgi:hypothetical protein